MFKLRNWHHAIGMKPLLLAALIVLTTFAADEDGCVPLFNGRDLSGWVNANCAPETWSVTNGMIHCTGHPTGAMRTERQYENFILEVEWRHLSSGGNSGVFIWGTPIAAPGVPFLRGIEVQVLDHGFNVPGKNQWYTTHGDVFPIHGAKMKPFGDAFIALVKMVIGPVIFLTIVVGMAKMGDLRHVGRIGVKALLYFEVLTTVALVIGLLVANLVKPGAGMHKDVASIDASAIADYRSAAESSGVVSFLQDIIPHGFVSAFVVDF